MGYEPHTLLDTGCPWKDPQHTVSVMSVKVCEGSVNRAGEGNIFCHTDLDKVSKGPHIRTFIIANWNIFQTDLSCLDTVC